MSRNFFRALFLSLVLFCGVYVHSLALTGSIDGTYAIAKFLDPSSRINFDTTYGNIVVTDSVITGYAWSERYGWINLSPTNGGIINDNEGNLSGYAWGENASWINFNPTYGGVTIDSQGFFQGYAWSENYGWISFNCENDSSCGTSDFKVKTDWIPFSARAICNNEVDDDNDGKTDYPDDPGCDSLTDANEKDPSVGGYIPDKVPVTELPQCSNTLDDDNDGKIDYPNDPGCMSVYDNMEFNFVMPPDGIPPDTLNPIDGEYPKVSKPRTPPPGVMAKMSIPEKIAFTISEQFSFIKESADETFKNLGREYTWLDRIFEQVLFITQPIKNLFLSFGEAGDIVLNTKYGKEISYFLSIVGLITGALVALARIEFIQSISLVSILRIPLKGWNFLLEYGRVIQPKTENTDIEIESFLSIEQKSLILQGLEVIFIIGGVISVFVFFAIPNTITLTVLGGYTALVFGKEIVLKIVEFISKNRSF